MTARDIDQPTSNPTTASKKDTTDQSKSFHVITPSNKQIKTTTANTRKKAEGSRKVDELDVDEEAANSTAEVAGGGVLCYYFCCSRCGRE